MSRWPSSWCFRSGRCSLERLFACSRSDNRDAALQLSPQQDSALSAVSAWLKRRDRLVFRLFGYAGTGKTTLARRIAEGTEGEVLFAAYTGKAAQVLRSKGAKNARTIHSLIYRPKTGEGEEGEEEGANGSPAFTLRRSSPVANADLVIIDECSMVDEALGRDLLSFGTPILVLGDPGQLPPISGGGFFTEAEPDVMLSEIHRQARENPIIDMAERVREGGRLDYGAYGESRVITRREIDADAVLAAEQVLVGRNHTRRQYNRRIRTLKGFAGPLPEVGDRLVCLRNNADKGLLNGGLWSVEGLGGGRAGALRLALRSDDEGTRARVRVARAAFTDEAPLSPIERRKHDEFDFGYALTVHKAQGSQWGDLLLFDESFAFKEHRARWLYTAITRAAERITIVR